MSTLLTPARILRRHRLWGPAQRRPASWTRLAGPLDEEYAGADIGAGVGLGDDLPACGGVQRTGVGRRRCPAEAV